MYIVSKHASNDTIKDYMSFRKCERAMQVLYITFLFLQESDERNKSTNIKFLA